MKTHLKNWASRLLGKIHNFLIEKIDPVEWTLLGPDMKCPKCGGITFLSRNELVFCTAFIQVNPESGTWDWTGDTEVLWDTQDHLPSVIHGEWHCHNCDIDFEAPDLPIPYTLTKE